MKITKKLDELINLVNSVQPLSLDSENLEYLGDKSAYEFGRDLSERLSKEEYIPTLEQATEIYHNGRISKLSADMETLSRCSRMGKGCDTFMLRQEAYRVATPQEYCWILNQCQ
jgi:hypothetical protein